MKRETIEIILKSMELTSKDETRPQLNGVCIQKTDTTNEFLVKATDGYTMIKTKIYDDSLAFVGFIKNIEIIIDNSKLNISLLKTALKCKLKMRFPELLQGLNTVHREFPKTDIFSPYKDEDCYQFAVNVNYLQNILKSLGSKSSRETKELNTLIFSVKKSMGDIKPIYLKIKADTEIKENYRVIMPIKL